MEKLTPEIIKQAIQNGRIFMPYDNENIILYKRFTVRDEFVAEYVQSINRLADEGINTPRIKDYKILSEPSAYGYSKYVILEEKAKGNNFDYKEDTYLSISETKPDFEKTSIIYLQRLDEYINEISLRADAPIEHYLKLVTDYIYITNQGLQIDPKPLNFFFDKDIGFTFIDINGRGKSDLKMYLPRYIFGCVLGYGIPSLSIGITHYNYIDQERLNRLKEAYNNIITKISAVLIKQGYSKEHIIEDSKNWIYQLNSLKLLEPIEDISNTLAIDFAKIKEEQAAKQAAEKGSDPDDWTIGW